MKARPLYLLPAACLLISCGEEKQPAPDTPNDPAPPKPGNATQKPAANPKPKPKVNVAKLNQDLKRHLNLGQSAEAVKAIEAGANPKAKDRYGLPILFTAARAGDAAVVKALVAAGADPNDKIGTSHNTDGAGYTGTMDGTPLGYAASRAQLEAMQALVEVGADVNGAGPEGTTPLMHAVDSGKFPAVEWLIQQGADAKAKNQHGGIALGKATMFINPDEDRQKIIDLLKKHSQ